MKVEFLFDMTAGGKYPYVDPVHLVRIFNFSQKELGLLRQVVQTRVVERGETLDIDQLDFVQGVNCTLRFEVTSDDLGIDLPSDRRTFICRLSRPSYANMLDIIDNLGDGYNWLYDPKNYEEIDLLLSEGGGW